MKAYALQQLSERFKRQPRSKALDEYISRKYSTLGYRKIHSIEYNPEWNPGDKYRWVENVSDGLREVGRADEILPRLGHTGWFIDNFQDETVHGMVYQMPARAGAPQYVPAVNDPWNKDCACLDFHSITEDKEDCARWADSMAERWAEREREYQAEESAKIRIEEIDEEIKTLYADFRRISRELRANCDAIKTVTVVRELVRDKWQDTKAEIHKLRAERSRIEQYGIEY